MTGSWEPQIKAIGRLIAAHPAEFDQLLAQAQAQAQAEAEAEQAQLPPCMACMACAHLGTAARALADRLGHDPLGHRLLHVLGDSGQIRSVSALRKAVAGRGLARIHQARDLLDRGSVPAVVGTVDGDP